MDISSLSLCLESNGYINWQPGKTNMDYFREIKNTELESDFYAFMKIYNLSWFGYHELNQEGYSIHKNRIMMVLHAIVPKNTRHEVDKLSVYLIYLALGFTVWFFYPV